MRRMRGVITASLLLIATLLFFTQYRSVLPAADEFRIPYGGSWNEDSSDLPEQPSASPDNDDISSSEIAPPRASIHHEPSLEDVPLEPPTSETPTSETPLSETPISETLPLSSESSSDSPIFEAEFPFQLDLKLDLPIEILKEASNNKPHNYEPNGPKTNAYATFMATRNPSLKDPYFMAIHSLIYRVLWSPRSRTDNYPLVVFVADFVTPSQRQLLSGAGAIVRELAPLEWNPNVEGIQNRWKDLFAKLNMWNQTEFSRIFFLDADAFPVTNVDSMMDISPMQDCIESKLQPEDYLEDGAQVCEPYVFAGVPQDPFNATDVNINVGSMVFTPSEKMHQRLLQNYVKTDRYNCLMAEQAFLNWQFNVNGAFPATQLEREYGGFFPTEDEEGKLKVVHEKLWSDNRAWLKQEWLSQWQEMLGFYTAREFLEERRTDGTSH